MWAVAIAAVLCRGAVAMQASETDGTDSPAEGFVFRSVEIEGRSYPYTVYRPRGLKDGGRALVFLHGMGECGTDGSTPLVVGLPPAMMVAPDRWPFVVLIPQKPTGESEWEDHEAAVLAMLDRLIEEDGVDPERVAITGLSQGGHGTIALASRHPGRFVAAAPVCGYVQRFWEDGERGWRAKPDGEAKRALIESFRSTPIWLLHGGRDDVVPPGESEWLHGALQDAGLTSKLTIFPDDNHNSWDSAYRESGLWAWLVDMTRAR